ncbi:hypothetical protein [Azohydromonas australica]|uniref:hypothetical protein n=1 Tax=Azohydromonas australica TaxID=364039 RepID=UPI00041FD112|nr:hypothetical protein [Azohydromonas australica]
MNSAFITQAQEAAKQWTVLSTAFFQQQADEFVAKAVKLIDAQCAQVLDAALQESLVKESLAPIVAGYKSASQAVVTAVEQLTQARKALLKNARVS